MDECYGLNFIQNGELKQVSDFNPSLVFEGESVYEVIRTSGGKPYFFTDHLERLELSARHLGKKMLATPGNIRNDIVRLASAEPEEEMNLKIVFNYNRGRYNYLLYYIPTRYPSEEQYCNGVTGILYFAERRDPEAKVINQGLRSSIYHRLILESAYEALLVNEAGLITEGSRSNIFFLSGETLVTAPGNLVLNGITRKHVLEICKTQEIEVMLDCPGVSQLKNFSSVFMTGTSPMLLPFSRVGEFNFDPHPAVIKRLRDLYIKRAKESIGDFESITAGI